jgi:hypothetical protein
MARNLEARALPSAFKLYSANFFPLRPAGDVPLALEHPVGVAALLVTWVPVRTAQRIATECAATGGQSVDRRRREKQRI